MLPQIYTPEEVAQILRLSSDEVIHALGVGQIQGFKIAGKWRISESSLQALVIGVPPSAKHGHITVSLKPSEPFDYTWPSGIEPYSDAYEGEVSLDGHLFYARIGVCTRNVFGRDRGRIVVFLDGYPATEFVETDLPNYYSSLLPGANNSRRNLRPGETVPTEFADFNIKTMMDMVKGPGVYNAQVVVAKKNDFVVMIKFALLKARYKGRI